MSTTEHGNGAVEDTYASSDGKSRTRQKGGIKLALKCARATCQQRILALHVTGRAIIDMILPCPRCGAQSSYAWTEDGVATYVLGPNPNADVSVNGTGSSGGVASLLARGPGRHPGT